MLRFERFEAVVRAVLEARVPFIVNGDFTRILDGAGSRHAGTTALPIYPELIPIQAFISPEHPAAMIRLAPLSPELFEEGWDDAGSRWRRAVYLSWSSAGVRGQLNVWI